MEKIATLLLDRAEGRRLARQVRAKPNQCWHNALKAFLSLNDPETLYVEGWMICGPIVIEHGWLQGPETIIDPTLCDDEDLSAEHYFPGATFDRLAVSAAIQRQGEKKIYMPFIFYSRLDDDKMREYYAASARAWEALLPGYTAVVHQFKQRHARVRS